MIRRTLPGLAVFALVAGLSGMLVGHFWNRYSHQTSELGFDEIYERYLANRPLSRIRELITLCMLAAAVVTIGLAIAGALTGARSPVPQLASQK